MQKKIICDFGANNGDDIPYYLKKADVIVAVEANASLCKQIETRFSSEITCGMVFVENLVLSIVGSKTEVEFYVHKAAHVLSQSPKPTEGVIDNFEKLYLPARSPIKYYFAVWQSVLYKN